MGINIDLTKFRGSYDRLKKQNEINKSLRDSLTTRISDLEVETNELEVKLDNLTRATTLLTSLKDESLIKTYRFIESNINNALSQIYVDNSRQIRLVERVHSDTHPQLDFELIVGNNTIDLSDSGHGLSQIISLISTMCLIVLKGERRLLCLDEVLSGVDYKGRAIVDTILRSFSDLGFQYIIVEHDFVPSGATVYDLALRNDTTEVVKVWNSGDDCYSGYKGTEVV